MNCLSEALFLAVAVKAYYFLTLFPVFVKLRKSRSILG
jgi:hypothetical protein